MTKATVYDITTGVKVGPKSGQQRTAKWRAKKAAAKAAAKATASPGVAMPSSPPSEPVTTGSARLVNLPSLITSIGLVTVSLALAGVGITMNGWYAESLGSSDVSGKLFLAVGICADLAAAMLPHKAADLWQGRQRVISLMAWVVWLGTFVFAIMAGIGFASTNISDVTSTRAGRVTPAVTAARDALGDVTAARDRECRGGVGKFCREREAAVVAARANLDAAMKTVAAESDPQTEAGTKIVAWVSAGTLTMTASDLAMLRLILLALLPQLGGIVMMIGRQR